MIKKAFSFQPKSSTVPRLSLRTTYGSEALWGAYSLSLLCSLLSVAGLEDGIDDISKMKKSVQGNIIFIFDVRLENAIFFYCYLMWLVIS